MLFFSQNPVDRLQWTIRALAQGAEVQKSLFPDFVCVADELALEFEEKMRGAQSELSTLTTEVRDAIAQLDTALDDMSGPLHAELWTDEALEQGPEWARIRKLALNVIRKAGWAETTPEPSTALYIGPRSTR